MKRGHALLIDSLKSELLAAADPARSPAMQAYLKSAMPFLGVSAVPLRAICKKAFAAHPIATAKDWRELILHLWRSASHREHRYAAIELSAYQRYQEFQSLEALPMYEELIASGAWWDYGFLAGGAFGETWLSRYQAAVVKRKYDPFTCRAPGYFGGISQFPLHQYSRQRVAREVVYLHAQRKRRPFPSQSSTHP